MKRTFDWAVTDVGEEPAARVAARTIRKRLEAVWSELRAVCRLRHEAERVHQLRVATRRTIAALTAFEDLLPVKRRHWFEKHLRRIRRAVGTTRDLDVLTGQLANESPAQDRIDTGRIAARARHRLVSMLAKRRDLSRRPIREIREALVAADWPGRVERLVDALATQTETDTFSAYARRRFPLLLDRFFVRADCKLKAAAEIHRLRITGKKLRYSLEIFAPVFPATNGHACLEALERLQKTLGDFTDHAAAADRFGRWARSADAGPDRDMLVSLREDESQQADIARKAFSKWWNPSRRRSLRRRFARTMRRSA